MRLALPTRFSTLQVALDLTLNAADLRPTAGAIHARVPEGQRAAFEASQFIPLAVLIGLGLIFYWMGAPTRQRQVDVSLVDEPATVAGTP